MSSNLTRTWTEERTELFKKRFGEGISFGVIAAELGLTRNSVIGKAHRLLLPRRGHSRSNQHGDYVKTPKTPKKHKQARNANNLRLVSMLMRGTLEPVELPDEIIANPLTIIELEPHNCRWPLLDGLYCGATIVCRSYCAKHYAMGYEGPRVRGWQRPDTSAMNRRRHLTAKAALSLIDTPSSGDLPVVAGGEEAA